MHLTWYVGTQSMLWCGCGLYILHFNHSISLGCIFLLSAVEILCWMIFFGFSLVLLCMRRARLPSRESGHHRVSSENLFLMHYQLLVSLLYVLNSLGTEFDMLFTTIESFDSLPWFSARRTPLLDYQAWCNTTFSVPSVLLASQTSPSATSTPHGYSHGRGHNNFCCSW